MKLIHALTVFLLLAGCDAPVKTPKQNFNTDVTINQTLSAGYYEEYLLEAKHLRGLLLDFDVKAVKDDDNKDSTPSVAVLLKDLKREQYFSVEYYQAEQPYLALLVVSGDDVWFDESIDLPAEITQMSVKFDAGNVFIEAKNFSHAMNVPFETEFVAISHASTEISNRIDFLYK